MSLEMKELLATFAHPGKVRWIGLRPDRRAKILEVAEVLADPSSGLEGDRFSGKPAAKRQVTLLQHEHLAVMAELLKRTAIDPALLRRNIVVSGIHLQALKQRNFKIGAAVLHGTGNCAPCSRMEETLGTGGYNAMRGHGGITAYVVEAGKISVGDSVVPKG
jgi:MOSC domain-containing protein YiiM